MVPVIFTCLVLPYVIAQALVMKFWCAHWHCCHLYWTAAFISLQAIGTDTQTEWSPYQSLSVNVATFAHLARCTPPFLLVINAFNAFDTATLFWIILTCLTQQTNSASLTSWWFRLLVSLIPAYLDLVCHALSEILSPNLELIHLKNAIALFNKLVDLGGHILFKMYLNT